ncbi:hypothetical protein LCGC14_2344500 [marine sediment metagenome]|uniref:Uncharacterized protein n=1 Tax=marine sediment metagenome TaxID=412755 RepID=A0A0F9F642_9ZZZZ
MNLFIVRDTKTHKFLPPVRAGHSTTGRDLGDIPRTFASRSAAESAARWWATGMHGRRWIDDDSQEVVYPVEGRDLNTLRVHKLDPVHWGFGWSIRPIGGTK